MIRTKIWLGLVALTLIITGCSTQIWNESISARYASNGERIYFTGTSATGRIHYSGGDVGNGMMGRGMMGGDQLACADCHGADARGGPHVMHMTTMDAPDIRWSTLTGDEHGEDDHHEDEDGMEHPPYDDAFFRQAVTQGLDPAGNPLDSAMPRWQMSAQDLADLIAYLKTLD